MTVTGPIDRFGIKVGNQVADPTAFVPTADLAVKTPARCATTANIVLSGLQTIDGVVLAEGDRILVKNQTDATKNGIYAASTGTWSRTTDANGNDDFTTGTAVTVTGGTLNSSKTFELTTASPVVLDTDLLAWAVINYPGSEFGFVFDGGGAAILPGARFALPVPDGGYTITEMDLLADRVGSIQIDIQKTTLANYPAGAVSICGTDKPTLVGAQSSIDTTLTGWTLTVTEGDVLIATVLSCTTITNVTCGLKVTRS